MLSLLWLIPAAPLLSYLVLALYGGRLSRRAIAWLGAGSVGVSALVSILAAVAYGAFSRGTGEPYVLALWPWIDVAGLRASFDLVLDPLAVVMTLVVTGVGFLIHVYSIEYMIDDEGYSRFFAYMNLFVASMVTLVLAADLLVLFLGWEGVGLCSYLLIGFWYRDPGNGYAARKAFIVTRIGDTAMTLGLLLLVTQFGTLNIHEMLATVGAQLAVGSPVAVTAATLLLGGALGKSAQLPLQTWLPDAMAGPTPTSALIHAATMVTAGVYLIARMNWLFALAPAVQTAVAVIGLLTLLMAGFSALMQWDLKRVLAYSTISQIGYMFLALGVGAYPAAIFHLMTHAFFKALLFMAAGAVIISLHHEQDMFRMGGLRRSLPVAWWSFLIGGAALAGVPLVTAGFYSKDLILWETWISPGGGPLLWIGGLLGVLLTAAYTSRLIFLVFFGREKTAVHGRPGPAIRVPLYVLGALSIIGGFVEIPRWLGNVPAFSNFVGSVFVRPETEAVTGAGVEALFAAVTTIVIALGVLLTWRLYGRGGAVARELVSTPPGRALHHFWFTDWGMDWLYDRLFVRPVTWIAGVNRGDVVDLIYTGLAALTRFLYRALRLTQTGRLRWYLAWIAAGSAIFLALVLLR